MTLITALGIASLIFVMAFTARAYGRGTNPRKAIIEAWVNIVIGFSINYSANLIFLPMLGANLSVSSNLWLGWIYTAISILRQYAIRRWFQNRLEHLVDTLSLQSAGINASIQWTLMGVSDRLSMKGFWRTANTVDRIVLALHRIEKRAAE